MSLLVLKNSATILIGTLTNIVRLHKFTRLVIFRKKTSFENVIDHFIFYWFYDYLIFTVLFYF